MRESYGTNALAAIDYSYSSCGRHVFVNINSSGSRFHYAADAVKLELRFDRSSVGHRLTMTKFRLLHDLRSHLASPAGFAITCSQGQSFIADHDTQFAFSPNLTWIRGRHTWVFGGQSTRRTTTTPRRTSPAALLLSTAAGQQQRVSPTANTGHFLRRFPVGLRLKRKDGVQPQYGEARFRHSAAGKETYRRLLFGDTWRVTSKLTLNYGVRYDLPGTWSERFNDMSYWDPAATNRTVTGCSGTLGVGVCPGDVFLVGDGANPTRNNLPYYQDRVHAAHRRQASALGGPEDRHSCGSWGFFFIPNWVFFNLNPSNDTINDANTLWLATPQRVA